MEIRGPPRGALRSRQAAVREKALWWGLFRNGERPPGRGLEVEGQCGEGCSAEVAAGAAENAYLVRDLGSGGRIWGLH